MPGLRGTYLGFRQLLRRDPAPADSLGLSAQVVWTTVVGQQHLPEGTRVLRYYSGLKFVALSPAQTRDVASLLGRPLVAVG